MACNCLDVMDAKLADHNTRICVTLGFPRDGSPAFTRPHIQTEKVEKRVRKGPAIALPSFCPFCGTNYDTGQETDKAELLAVLQRCLAANCDGQNRDEFFDAHDAARALVTRLTEAAEDAA